MSELTRTDPAIKPEDKKEVDKPEQKETTVQPDKWELKAVESGWQSKEDWVAAGKAEDEWRPAREYVERGELFDKIDTQTKELKQLRKVLDTLKTHHLQVKQQAFEDAVASLKAQRNKAKQEEDLGKVIEITDEIDNLKDKQAKEIKKAQEELNAPPEPGPSEAFKVWHKKNDWYKVNGRDPMSVFANAEADAFLRENRTATEADVFAHVEKKVKEEFADRFKAKTVDPKVESNTGSRGTSSRKDAPTLTETEEKIMKTLVKSGVMTEEQYLKDLKKFGA